MGPRVKGVQESIFASLRGWHTRRLEHDGISGKHGSSKATRMRDMTQAGLGVPCGMLGPTFLSDPQVGSIKHYSSSLDSTTIRLRAI